MIEVAFNITKVIISAVISIIIIELGALMLKEFTDKPLIGLIIILGFLLLYFSFYTSQVKTNQDNILELKDEIEKIKDNEIAKEKLLNNIKDIVLLNNVEKKWGQKTK